MQYLTGTALFLGLCSVCFGAYVICSFSSTCMARFYHKFHTNGSANFRVKNAWNSIILSQIKHTKLELEGRKSLPAPTVLWQIELPCLTQYLMCQGSRARPDHLQFLVSKRYWSACLFYSNCLCPSFFASLFASLFSSSISSALLSPPEVSDFLTHALVWRMGGKQDKRGEEKSFCRYREWPSSSKKDGIKARVNTLPWTILRGAKRGKKCWEWYIKLIEALW